MHSLLPEAPLQGGLLGRVQYWFACFFVVGWAGVVCGGLFHQFGAGEHTCPLCVVQRMCMVLAALGAGHIVRTALRDGAVTGRDYMTGWGLALVAVVAGSFASWRQTMLHVLPGDKGYGGELFGLHLYVWAWILFQLSVVAIGVVLAFAHATADRAVPTAGPGAYRTVGLSALWFLGLVIAANLVAVFLEEGFHWFLPDDPSRYELFHDLGI
ncbi:MULTISPECIES: disulfide bond formation protein B [unclassified Streptomyces]|uniref:disulfide bond formation protein B n=1 Tax=unclassified Streptomyces TaxID=2593676 RepID=UPI0022558D9E|nr:MULTISPECIES: disulfide bond formation protein B [unclassified Streptomyces]MCX4525998.1 disulfide bond formation protein B [Streptomyces sp. NBC_01551]MCX4543439.1 disulfide bond formation protein B [Streptomyces sp. NBC_01565]